MFDENAFSLDAFNDGSWLFLLDVPYFDLSGRQRLYVRTVLESVYSVSEVNQIVSVATQNNLSVLDASTVARISTGPLQVFVRGERKTKPEKQVREPAAKQSPARKNLPVYAVTRGESIRAINVTDRVFTSATSQVVFARTSEPALFLGASNGL